MTKIPAQKSARTKSAGPLKARKQLRKVKPTKTIKTSYNSPASSGQESNPTKASRCLELLRCAEGASLDELMTATGWQSHSVRGFLSGAVKRKLGLTVTSAVGSDDVRRYHVATVEA